MDETLTARMERLQIREADLVEKFVQGSGPGGQKINKTSSCVYLRHIPTGYDVQCQEGRSRERNREIARERLCERIEERRKIEVLDKARARAKIRFAKRKPSPATKARLKETKKFRADKKGNRKRIIVKKHDD